MCPTPATTRLAATAVVAGSSALQQEQQEGNNSSNSGSKEAGPTTTTTGPSGSGDGSSKLVRAMAEQDSASTTAPVKLSALAGTPAIVDALNAQTRKRTALELGERGMTAAHPDFMCFQLVKEGAPGKGKDGGQGGGWGVRGILRSTDLDDCLTA